MGKTISIKVLFGIYFLLMAGKVFAFSCNVDGGSSIGAGTTSVYVNLDPVIQPGQNLVVDLSQHISCWNDYGGWYDTDHINLVQGSAFAGSLQSYKGSLYWNNVTYPFPLTTNTNVLDIGDKTPMPLPLKLYITPVGAAGGVVIKAGEVIARIHMYKIATLGSGNPRNLRGILFQITVLLCQQAAALLIVVMSPWISRTFLEAQKYPLAYIAQANKSSHFIFRVPPLTVPDKCLLTRHLMQQKHREWVSL